MKKVEIKFKIVTPMILGGANQNEAELRASSIRGELRNWFRILGGSLDEERKVFGGIGKKDEGRASGIVVRVKSNPSTLSSQTMQDIKTADDKFDYFLWPLRRNEDARGIITDNQEVEISISQRRVRDSQELDEKIIKAFLLLGSLGSRSRRAYGSIYPTSVMFDGVEWNIPTTEEYFQEEITKLLQNVNCKVLKLNSANTAKQAIKTCSNALKKFRCGSSRSGNPTIWGQNDHDIRYGNDDGNNYRAAVALPLSQRYSDKQTFSTSINRNDRWASPVIFKILYINNQFIPIVIFLKDYFIPENTKVTIGNNRERSFFDKTVSHDLLNEMMKESSCYWNEASCIYE